MYEKRFITLDNDPIIPNHRKSGKSNE